MSAWNSPSSSASTRYSTEIPMWFISRKHAIVSPEKDRSPVWLELALAIGIGLAALLAVPAVLSLRPATPTPLAHCPAPAAGEVLLIRIAATAAGPLEARCTTAQGRTPAGSSK